MDSWRGPSVPDLPGRGPVTKITDTASGELAAAAAGPVAWDLLARAWRDAGHAVIYVQNVTDVDDPLLERAARDGEDWRELAGREVALFRGDMEALRLLPPEHYVGAVEALPVIERFSGLLSEHGALYDLDGDAYQARSADPSFGAVSGLDPATMVTLFGENGGDPARPGKKDPLDPLVWLAARPGEPAWPSDLGLGRPGWHVECAAIATEYLGVTFDVQAGGSDLTFPHHEMTASHARVAYGGPVGPAGPVFARRYAHAGMVRLDGEKMSKSRGNLVFVSALLAAGNDPMAVRLAILAHHYRQDWDWTDAGLAAARHRLSRWQAALAAAASPPPSTEGSGQVPPVPPADSVLGGVRERLADDLDAPGALAVIDGWADAVLAAAPGPSDAGLVRDTVDALLGIAL